MSPADWLVVAGLFAAIAALVAADHYHRHGEHRARRDEDARARRRLLEELRRQR